MNRNKMNREMNRFRTALKYAGKNINIKKLFKKI